MSQSAVAVAGIDGHLNCRPETADCDCSTDVPFMSDTATSTVSRGPGSTYRRRMPIGAEPIDRGLAHVRVWASQAKRVHVVVRNGLKAVPLDAEAGGYFSGVIRASL